MNLFRIWQPHTQEYMFAWNSVVGLHTIKQLSPTKRNEVYEHYYRILAINHVDLSRDVGMLAKHDPFWLAFTLGDLGIPPMLGPKAAKWFYVSDPRTARWNMASQADTLIPRIGQEILDKHGITLQVNDNDEV